MTSPTDDLDALAETLPAIIARQKEALAVRTREMQTLKREGLIYAAEHWRAKKYLYLIFPSHNGERERRYVGADESKVAEARAAIQRAKDYDRLAADVRSLEQCLARGRDSLQAAINNLTTLRAW